MNNHKFRTISIECPLCNRSHLHLTKEINFKNSENGTKSRFLQKICPECHEPIALRYSLEEDPPKVLEFFSIQDTLSQKLEFLKTFIVNPASRSNDSMRKLKEKQKRQQFDDFQNDDSVVLEEEIISLKEVYS